MFRMLVSTVCHGIEVRCQRQIYMGIGQCLEKKEVIPYIFPHLLLRIIIPFSLSTNIMIMIMNESFIVQSDPRSTPDKLQLFRFHLYVIV